MVDLHSHIIPAFDDGCKNLEESLQMATTQSTDGTVTMIATPHVENQVDIDKSEEIVDRVAGLNEEIKKAGIRLTVLPGAELFPCASVIRGLEDQCPLTLAGTGRYVLFDLPHGSTMPSDFDQTVFGVLARRITPIFAHPERSPFFCGNIEQVESYIERGVVFQVNSGSFIGKHGPHAEDFAFTLFNRRLAQFLASDAHRGQSRTLGSVAKMLSTPGNEAYVQMLTVESGKAVINGAPLPPRPAPIPEEEKRPWYSRFTRPFHRHAL
jgi:protein-tyrosine phosphatase